MTNGKRRQTTILNLLPPNNVNRRNDDAKGPRPTTNVESATYLVYRVRRFLSTVLWVFFVGTSFITCAVQFYSVVRSYFIMLSCRDFRTRCDAGTTKARTIRTFPYQTGPLSSHHLARLRPSNGYGVGRFVGRMFLYFMSDVLVEGISYTDFLPTATTYYYV